MSIGDLSILVFFAVATIAVSPWFLIGVGVVAVLFVLLERDAVRHTWKWR